MDKFIKDVAKGEFTGDRIEFNGIVHLKYEDCKAEDLVNFTEERTVHKKVLEVFEQMKEAAKLDDIDIFIVSGFRSKEYQKDLFPIRFKDKTNPTVEEFEARLKFSAPAGFSEHHTGLAIDINSVEDDFADTKEAEWLKNNAPKFGFELSFPKDNKQHIGYEPWHWRYVGDESSKKIFEQARNL